MFGAHYLENGWRYRLGYNRAPIGNDTWDIKWSRNLRRHGTLEGQGCGSVIRIQISRKAL